MPDSSILFTDSLGVIMWPDTKMEIDGFTVNFTESFRRGYWLWFIYDNPNIEALSWGPTGEDGERTSDLAVAIEHAKFRIAQLRYYGIVPTWLTKAHQLSLF